LWKKPRKVKGDDQGYHAAAMKEYYAQRAPEYEAIYGKPERQPELAILKDWLAGEVRGRRVLEVACGTGYWTAVAAQAAQSIAAYDINEETLAIARAKELGAHVAFSLGDAYAPTPGDYDCVLAAFWWSHIPKSRIAGFVSALAAAARPGARLLLLDNAYAAGSSTPIARTDGEGNLYQRRKLADGSTHEVLKNFPDRASLNASLSACCAGIHPDFMRYYWRLAAEFNQPQEPT
jgi:demethylmenaquinone methyltransferase/2-methoxy-6-polyprenyl-1,4-benzoquinol methylase